ncbi:hypothetical protein [Sphingomonas sp. 3-13AW]|uniref:hypothetical protein n=1 Tax=Sphingomonas sp. 3-13AW TaxID=3050450 RepID=UPI003BB5A056
MARIRSVHPGLWTDERFVSLTLPARLLFIGLWNECDDQGSFEWSPIKLKMRLLPADNADTTELLAELEGGQMVMKYEAGGRQYGAVRNFCQYQRPKKPNSVHPQTDEVREWVRTVARSIRDGGEGEGASEQGDGEPKARATPSSGEVVGNQLPTGGEKRRQRKEEGGRSSSVANATGASAPPDDPVKALIDTGIALLVSTGTPPARARSMIGKWRKDQGDAPTLAAIVAARDAGITQPVEWITARFRSAGEQEDEALAISRATAERYRRMEMAGPPRAAGGER